MAQQDHFQLRTLKSDNLEQVAKCHLKVFPKSLLSKLGAKAIKMYYVWHMQPPNVCYATGAFQEDHLIGFCFAGTFRNAELFFFKDHWLFFLRIFLTHPRLLLDKEFIRLFQKMLIYFQEYKLVQFRNKMTSKDIKTMRFGILSIAVDPGKQGLGVGKALMDEVERIANEKGYDKIELSVHPGNAQALSFYEKLGWKKVLKGQDQTWQGYMEKSVN